MAAHNSLPEREASYIASSMANLGEMTNGESSLRESYSPVRVKPKWKSCSQCERAARGSSGLCQAHGGGPKCRHDGCTKAARGVTHLCVQHGGGKRCEHQDENGILSCTSTARGSSGFCVRHGGGVACIVEGCTKAGRGVSRTCTKHGGGRRCDIPGCSKAARGSKGLCVKHGGGARCQFDGCPKAAKARSPYCSAHGAPAESSPAEPIQTHYPIADANQVHGSLSVPSVSAHEFPPPQEVEFKHESYLPSVSEVASA